MRLARFHADGENRFGRIQDGKTLELAGAYFGKNSPEETGRRFALDSVRLLCPTLPSKIVCVGVNYRDHAAEFGHEIPEEPCLFMKPETAVIGPEDAIIHPPVTQRMDYEAELAAVIGSPLRHANKAAARAGILGYTCLNDVTARDLQRKDGQWTRAKGFDTFCPIGPWIETDVDPSALDITLTLNGETRQHSNTSQLIRGAVALVSFVSAVMTLRPGDVVATGTPSGVGPMKPGDVVEVRIEGIGTLRNSVAAAE